MSVATLNSWKVETRTKASSVFLFVATAALAVAIAAPLFASRAVIPGPLLLAAAPIMFAVGWALQYAVLNRTLGDDVLPPLLVTFGLSIVIQNALLEGFSADSRRISAGALETASLQLGPVSVGTMPLLTFVSAIAVIVGLNLVFYRPALGRAFRATSDDHVTAGLMGHSRRPAERHPARLQPARRLPHRRGRKLLVPRGQAEILSDSR